MKMPINTVKNFLSLRYLTMSLWLSISLLLIIIGLLLIYSVYRIGYSATSISYNEGWNAYHAIRIFSGQALYNPQNDLIPVNYPPLSFYIVGSVGKLINDTILAGRYFSLFSLLIIFISVIYMVNKLCINIYCAFFSGVFCLSLFMAFAQVYVGMNDPQLLGHVLILIGFLIYLQPPTQKYRLLLSAALMMAGLFTKHNLISLPLAVTFDLLSTCAKLISLGCAPLRGAHPKICVINFA